MNDFIRAGNMHIKKLKYFEFLNFVQSVSEGDENRSRNLEYFNGWYPTDNDFSESLRKLKKAK